MYKSVASWCNVPFSIKSFVKRTGTGTKEYKPDVLSSFCLPQGKVQLVSNGSGAEVTSTLQLIVGPNTPIKVEDSVLFQDLERPILAIAPFFYKGVLDLQVVYLK